jgi:alkylhydroperoxidase family enzyme
MSPASYPKPVITRIPRDELTTTQQAQWDMIVDKLDDAPSVEVFAHHPAATSIYGDFYRRIFFNANDDMVVEYKHKELFRYKLGQMHGCVLCATFNTQPTLDVGYTPEQLASVLTPDVAQHFSDKELAVLELAEQFALQNLDAQLTPELYARLREHFSDAAIIEFGVLGAFFMGWQRLLFAYDLVPREQLCAVPTR